MSVGIITMYHNSKNCGGLLQAYALCKAVKNLGKDAEQICYKPENLLQENLQIYKKIKKEKQKYWIFNIWKNPKYVLEKICKKFIPHKMNDSRQTDFSRFKDFEMRIPHSDKVYDESVLDELNDKYDTFICGSDQVWHLSYVAYRGYFLDFADANHKCIAYAVSTGKINVTPIEKKNLENKLCKFKKIGVREKTYADSLKENYNANIVRVLDPVFLLDKEEWWNIETKQNVPADKYIFVYFLGNDDKWGQIIEKYAREKNLKVFFWNQNRELENVAKELQVTPNIFSMGPLDFLALIHHAEIIFTDSFHATAFSILFEKNFAVFNREKGSGMDNMNFRIKDILELFNLEKCLISNLEDGVSATTIDYNKINSILQKEKKLSIEFLKEELID